MAQNAVTANESLNDPSIVTQLYTNSPTDSFIDFTVRKSELPETPRSRVELKFARHAPPSSPPVVPSTSTRSSNLRLLLSAIHPSKEQPTPSPRQRPQRDWLSLTPSCDKRIQQLLWPEYFPDRSSIYRRKGGMPLRLFHFRATSCQVFPLSRCHGVPFSGLPEE